MNEEYFQYVAQLWKEKLKMETPETISCLGCIELAELKAKTPVDAEIEGLRREVEISLLESILEASKSFSDGSKDTSSLDVKNLVDAASTFSYRY